MRLAEFQAAGQMLHRAGLISGSSGNLSLRLNGNLLITRHGSILDDLSAADLVETGIFQNDACTPLASSELPVHREIYLRTPSGSIVHSHAPYAVTLSLEGCPMPCGAPTVGSSLKIAPGELAAEIAGALKHHDLVVVRGHGPFAVGPTLADACRVTMEFEAACRRLCQEQGLNIRPAQE